MNSILFNKVKNTENISNDLEDVADIDVTDVVENNNFVAAMCGVSGDVVLVLKDETALNSISETVTTKPSFRLQPFYGNNAEIKSLNEFDPFLGYNFLPNQSFGMQQNSVRTARFINVRFLQLSSVLNNLINHAPNAGVKRSLESMRQETFISIAVMQNIIRILSNSPMPRVNKANKQENLAFCNELNNAISLANQIVNGLIRLNRQVRINQISNQITILTITTNNMLNNLRDFRRFC